MEKPISIIETHLLRRQSTMGLEPVEAEAKRTLGRGLHRAIGAPSLIFGNIFGQPPFKAFFHCARSIG